MGQWAFPGNLDRIEYRPISNAATRVAALCPAKWILFWTLLYQDLKRIEGGRPSGQNRRTDPVYLFRDGPSVDELRTSDVKGANPFKDQRVREAANLAIDKKAIQRVVMEGLSFRYDPVFLGIHPKMIQAMVLTLTVKNWYSGIWGRVPNPTGLSTTATTTTKKSVRPMAMLAKLGLR